MSAPIGASFWIDFSRVNRYNLRTFGTVGYRRFLDEMGTAFLRGAKHVQDDANALIKGGAGSNLAKSSRVTARVDATTMQATVEWGARYARWVNDGRGPVEAINARFLRFVIDGVVFFRKRVGPSKPVHFAERGLASARPAVDRELQAGIGRWVQWAGGAA